MDTIAGHEAHSKYQHASIAFHGHRRQLKSDSWQDGVALTSQRARLVNSTDEFLRVLSEEHVLLTPSQCNRIAQIHTHAHMTHSMSFTVNHTGNQPEKDYTGNGCVFSSRRNSAVRFFPIGSTLQPHHTRSIRKTSCSSCKVQGSFKLKYITCCPETETSTLIVPQGRGHGKSNRTGTQSCTESASVFLQQEILPRAHNKNVTAMTATTVHKTNLLGKNLQTHSFMGRFLYLP